MPKSPRKPHHKGPAPIKPRDEALREALKKVYELIPSVDRILHAAKKAGHPVPISRSGLDQFIDGETKSLTVANRKPLEDFLFHTPLGRALRAPTANAVSAYDSFIAALTSGERPAPVANNVEGLYYLYHGSYARRDRFTVRVLDVRSIEVNVLAATDYLRDNYDVADTVLEAYGCGAFFGGLPQFIFTANHDKRVGLSLIIATRTSPQDKPIKVFLGKLTGTARGGMAFQRECLAVKETDGPAGIGGHPRQEPEADAYIQAREQMIDESGMYRIHELKGQHRKAIDDLARLMPSSNPDDPIFDLQK